MNRVAFREHILDKFRDSPQRFATADHALIQAYAALDELAKVGWALQIVTDVGGNVQDAHAEFPKMLYHELFGEVAVLDAESEKKHREQGWRLHPSLEPKELGRPMTAAEAKVMEDRKAAEARMAEQQKAAEHYPADAKAAEEKRVAEAKAAEDRRQIEMKTQAAQSEAKAREAQARKP